MTFSLFMLFPTKNGSDIFLFDVLKKIFQSFSVKS